MPREQGCGGIEMDTFSILEMSRLMDPRGGALSDELLTNSFQLLHSFSFNYVIF